MIFDMIGKKYGRLTILDQYYKISGNGEKRDYCLCRCDCDGNIKEIMGKNIRNNKSTSCGCYLQEIRGKSLKKYNEYNLTNEYGICYLSSSDDYFIFDKEDFEKIKNFCWG